MQNLWNKHYRCGVTRGFHGDMAAAFKLMLEDIACTEFVKAKILKSIQTHKMVERMATHKGRKWFTESFTTVASSL